MVPKSAVIRSLRSYFVSMFLQLLIDIIIPENSRRIRSRIYRTTEVPTIWKLFPEGWVIMLSCERKKVRDVIYIDIEWPQSPKYTVSSVIYSHLSSNWSIILTLNFGIKRARKPVRVCPLKQGTVADGSPGLKLPIKVNQWNDAFWKWLRICDQVLLKKTDTIETTETVGLKRSQISFFYQQITQAQWPVSARSRFQETRTTGPSSPCWHRI